MRAVQGLSRHMQLIQHLRAWLPLSSSCYYPDSIYFDTHIRDSDTLPSLREICSFFLFTLIGIGQSHGIDVTSLDFVTLDILHIYITLP